MLKYQKQVALAFQQYTQDFDEMLPTATDGGDGKDGGWIWYQSFSSAVPTTTKFNVTKGSLYPYVKNQQIYVCPSDSTGQKNGLSYAVNACLENSAGALNATVGGIRTGRSIADFNNTAMWMQTGEESNAVNNSTDDGYMSPSNSWTARHLQGTNMSFLDGHVKFVIVSPSGTISPNYVYGGGTSCPP